MTVEVSYVHTYIHTYLKHTYIHTYIKKVKVKGTPLTGPEGPTG
jgi:hypothetical protein